ncbi:hypothetical protein BLNAU_24684 [Blattamonas nauphoetae]|uniref:Uncharacterized protein n=1 Tax=Blattamonas nauphoetae TaxID=2049346 RepID=A0ABQ9WMK2_9EUKA|nr:hypothetical protein BLNAU_24684 [Blattamonas nauphoetae]
MDDTTFFVSDTQLRMAYEPTNMATNIVGPMSTEKINPYRESSQAEDINYRATMVMNPSTQKDLYSGLGLEEHQQTLHEQTLFPSETQMNMANEPTFFPTNIMGDAPGSLSKRFSNSLPADDSMTNTTFDLSNTTAAPTTTAHQSRHVQPRASRCPAGDATSNVRSDVLIQQREHLRTEPSPTKRGPIPTLHQGSDGVTQIRSHSSSCLEQVDISSPGTAEGTAEGGSSDTRVDGQTSSEVSVFLGNAEDLVRLCAQNPPIDTLSREERAHKGILLLLQKVKEHRESQGLSTDALTRLTEVGIPPAMNTKDISFQGEVEESLRMIGEDSQKVADAKVAADARLMRLRNNLKKLQNNLEQDRREIQALERQRNSKKNGNAWIEASTTAIRTRRRELATGPPQTTIHFPPPSHPRDESAISERRVPSQRHACVCVCIASCGRDEDDIPTFSSPKTPNQSQNLLSLTCHEGPLDEARSHLSQRGLCSLIQTVVGCLRSGFADEKGCFPVSDWVYTFCVDSNLTDSKQTFGRHFPPPQSLVDSILVGIKRVMGVINEVSSITPSQGLSLFIHSLFDITRSTSSQTFNDWTLRESQWRDLLLFSLNSDNEGTLHASLPSLAQLVNSWHNHSPMLTFRSPLHSHLDTPNRLASWQAQFHSNTILVARHNCGPAVRHATPQPVHTTRFEGVWDAAPSVARFVSARDLGIVQPQQLHSSKDASRHPQRGERCGRCFASADHSITAVQELQHATIADRSSVSVDVVRLAESPANVELLATSCFSTPPSASHLPLPFSPALLRLPLSTLLTLSFSNQIAVLRHLNPTQDRTAISATTSPSSEQKRDITSPSSASSGTDIIQWLSSRSPKSASTASSRLESVEERNKEPKTADERFRSSDELRQASALPTSMHSVQLPNQTIQPSSP